METFRDLVARMATDPDFARHARANPDAVARQYKLSPEETEQLRGLVDAAASAGPAELGVRLSKMGGVITSGLIDTLHVQIEPVVHGPAIDPAVHHVNLHIVHAVDPVVVHVDPPPAPPSGDPAPPSYPGDMFGDNDGDGIPNFIDPTPNGGTPDPSGDPAPPSYPGDMFGDNDGDGIPNFIDPTPDGSPHPKFTNVHVDLLGPVIHLGGDSGDPTPPPGDGGDGAPPDGGDHTPPPGDHHDSPPADTGTPMAGEVPLPLAAQQQPVMLADDALARPVTQPVSPEGHDGIGTEALIIGGAALAGGAIVGGVAGVVLNKAKSNDEE
jgi:hypothetical protein